ncbi:MAG: Hpt domain-containing protein [Lachnospiraceae bacterium]|nr:Hpt domain-containing protein [Lachnospiraceae bacterium]
MMDDKMIQELRAAGVDIDGASERFMGNMALLERFLKKFLEDKHFDELMEAFDAEDTEKAFQAAHTLKGVCGNLSLTTLFHITSDVTEHLRAGDMDLAKEKLPGMQEEYEKMIAVISKL